MSKTPRPFVPPNVAVLTLSDLAHARDRHLRRPDPWERLLAAGHQGCGAHRRARGHRQAAQSIPAVGRRPRHRRDHLHRRHRHDPARPHARGREAVHQQADPRLRRAVPPAVVRRDRYLHHPIARRRRHHPQRHHPLHDARLDQRLSPRHGPDHPVAARRQLPAVQPGGAAAAHPPRAGAKVVVRGDW
ncbi:MAG: hypothetical protein MZU91_08545 [Desulfosudis oleivorans]|nr:hypothetical protein [Desulfosudis oleivorans]